MTAPAGPLAYWWVWPVTVQRYTGTGTFGPTHAAPVTLQAKVTAKRRLILAPDGTEVVSEARVSLPADTALIPAGSLVTLPAAFGGRTARVLADQLHHGGGGTPNFYSLEVT
ncbi:hypothetical protein GQ85_11030 [Rhodococcus rhodochrous]|nr:hypothetical protein GQ85_11030 [Rhodococcus rhodochrous]